MRVIDNEFQARLDGGATTMCRCWLMTRSDGMRLGFTDHDDDLVFDAVTFRAGSGLDAGALHTSTGLSVDNSHVRGALTSASLLASDIQAGRYDNAEVRHWLVDWTDPTLKVLLFRGHLGEIKHGPSAFEAELRGLAEALNKPLGRAYLRTCDAVLGDARCGVDLGVAEHSAATVIEGIEAGVVRIDALAQFADRVFDRGMVEWLAGANIGHRSVIKQDVGRNGFRYLELWQETPVGAAPGDLIKLTVGCDKRAATCKAKFGNFLNFRGCPHLPGDDWIISYPSQGDKLDGGSMFRG